MTLNVPMTLQRDCENYYQGKKYDEP
jgi:hypothetical protein